MLDSTMAYAFLTVGTTQFDKLLDASQTSEFLLTLIEQHGCSELRMQIGRGLYEPDTLNGYKHGVNITAYRFKDTLADDIAGASLVISHAGAGSIFECLRAKKRLVVVVNEALMDNHQIELASQLQWDDHLIYTTCSGLTSKLRAADLSSLKPLPPANPEAFTRLLDEEMGFIRSIPYS